MTAPTTGFKYSPHPGQMRIHKALSTHRFVVCVAHRRFGKTEAAIGALFSTAAAAAGEDALYFYLAPFLKQAKQIAWRKLKRLCRSAYGPDVWSKYALKNESELWVELHNGARIILLGADNADSLRGSGFDGGVIDEIADAKKSDLWDGIIRPALADRQGWCLFIGTPKGMNLLYDLHQRGLRGQEHWKSLTFSVTQTKLPWLPQEEIDMLREDMSEGMFRQEMLCDFQASSEDALFPLDLLSKSTARQLAISDIKDSARVIGIDVAGSGKDSDETVFTKVQGLLCLPQIVVREKDTPAICDILGTMMMEWQADAAIVDNGRGFAVVEEMRRRGFNNIYGVDFGGSAQRKDIFVNKKAEMFVRLRKALDAGLKIPNCPKLFAQLSAHKLDYSDVRGRLQVTSKDEVKKALGGASPDRADSLVIAKSMDIAKRQLAPFATQPKGTVEKYLNPIYNPSTSHDGLDNYDVFA